MQADTGMGGSMLNRACEIPSSELIVASSYRGLQYAVSALTGDVQPPCCFCTDRQIFVCSESGQECDKFMRYYSNYEA